MADLVGAKTELRRNGVNLVGLCPFHEERTPSFSVNAEKKVYYCFGCEASGDAIGFVMETEALDFSGALELLADRYGVELQRESEDPEAERRRRRRERLLALLERAGKFYAAYLWKADEAAASREYLLGRGLREETLREFGVGYAPGGVGPADLRGPARRLHRRRAAGRRPVAAPARGHRPDRPLPGPDHLPAQRPPRPPARLRRARDAGGPAAQVPEHLRGRGLPQGQPALRPRPGPGGCVQGGPGRGGGGLHRCPRPTPGGRPRDGRDHGHRADRRAARRAHPCRARASCWPSTPTARGRRRCSARRAWRRAATWS